MHGIAGIVFVPLFLHAAALMLPTPSLQPARWTNEVLEIKKRIARETDKPEILILAGSNALFSLSAKTIAESYGIPATNLATHAGLGRTYLLASAAQVVAPGDLVVMPLEYELWEEERYEPALAYHVLTHDRNYYRALAPLEKLRLLAGIGVSDWLWLVKNRVVPDSDTATGYRSETLNEHGDETNNRRTSVDPAMRDNLTRIRARRFTLSSDTTRELKAFDDRLRAMGARLVVTYPSFLRSAVNDGSAAFLADVRREAKAAGLALVGDPHDRMFETEDAFDTAYHANDVEQQRNTHILMAQLRAAGIALPHPLVADAAE